jgi:hypothetical protein
MGFPRKYSNVSEGAIASYDYIDAIGGVGYKTFYGSGGEDSTGNTYFLTNNSLDSAHDNLLSSNSTSTPLSIDFDITFNTTAIVESANAILNFTIATAGSSSGYIDFTIYHVRDSTATSIGTTRSQTYSSSFVYRELLNIALTRSVFTIGDKLRLNATITRTTGTVSLRHETTSRSVQTETGTGVTIASSLKLDIPFKLDL